MFPKVVGGGSPPPPAPVGCVFPMQYEAPAAFTLPYGTSVQMPVVGDGMSGTLLIPAVPNDHAWQINGTCANVDLSAFPSGTYIPAAPGNVAYQINHRSTLPAPGGTAPPIRVSEIFMLLDLAVSSGFYLIGQRDYNNVPQSEVTFEITDFVSGTSDQLIVPAPTPGDLSFAVYVVQDTPTTGRVGVVANGVDYGFIQQGGVDMVVGRVNTAGFANIHAQGGKQDSGFQAVPEENRGIAWEVALAASKITEPLPAGFSFTDLCGNPI